METENNASKVQDSSDDEEVATVTGDVAVELAEFQPSKIDKTAKKSMAVEQHVKLLNSLDASLTIRGEDHDAKPTLPVGWQYQMRWIVDVFVLGFLKYIFCMVGAIIIHDDKATYKMFRESLAIGVGVQCSSTLITCLITSKLSKIKINISGPDIIACLFVVNWAKVLTKYPQEQAVPTLTFLIFLSTFLMGFVWYILGYIGATRIVQFLPEPVVNGFLGCIAWKVLKYAGKVALGRQETELVPWIMLFVSLILGTTLFFLKREHFFQKYGGAMVILPTFLFAPLIVFYIVFLAIGEPLTTYREWGVMFPEFAHRPFWELYTESYGQWFQKDKIAFGAVRESLPDMIVMMIILVVDSLLKLAATKSALEMEVDVRYEIELTGKENVVAALAGISAPGYPQVKFNILSYGILGNKLETRVGYGVGLFCGIMWLCGGAVPLLNILPRFLLSSLLFYAAMPFIDNYLYKPCYTMKYVDIFTIYFILVVVIFVDQVLHMTHAMLDGVVLGIVISVFAFVYQSTQITVIRNATDGRLLRSKVVRSYWEEALLTRVGQRVSVLQFDGFIFFASAASIFERVKSILEESSKRRRPEQTRYFLFDFEHVQSVDESGIKMLKDVQRYVQNHDGSAIRICYTGLTKMGQNSAKLDLLFMRYGLIPGMEDGGENKEHRHRGSASAAGILIAPDIDYGMELIEDKILTRASRVRSKWLVFDSFIKLHKESLEKQKYQEFEIAIGSNVGHNIWEYAELKEIKKGDFLCKEGEMNSSIFILQTGRVTSYTAQDSGVVQRIQTVSKGAVVNDACIFLNLPVSHSIVADKDSTFWCISKEKLKLMEQNEPRLALAVTQHILRHSSSVRQRLERDLHSLEHGKEPTSKKTARVTESAGDFHNSLTLNLGSTVLSKIRKAHLDFQTQALDWRMVHGDDSGKAEQVETLMQYDADHHVHNFRHLKLQRLPTGELKVALNQENEKSAEWGECNPHLSQMQEKKAKKWFEFHLNDQSEAVFDANLKSPSANLKSDGRISLGLTQKAIMDLGIFPTIQEVRNLHTLLSEEKPQNKKSEKIGIDMFLKMVEKLTLANLKEVEIASLHKIFKQYALEKDGKKVLTKKALQELMKDLGHEEDDSELDCIMNEWDVNREGNISFEALVSVVATYLHLEKLDSEMEVDFGKLCNCKEPVSMNPEELAKQVITKEALIESVQRYGGRHGITVNEQLAEEMIFDADIELVDHKVTFDELITTLEMIGPEEIVESISSKENSLVSALSVPSGMHLSFKRRESKRNLLKQNSF
jgi:sulfate permease, SulP family